MKSKSFQGKNFIKMNKSRGRIFVNNMMLTTFLPHRNMSIDVALIVLTSTMNAFGDSFLMRVTFSFKIGHQHRWHQHRRNTSKALSGNVIFMLLQYECRCGGGHIENWGATIRVKQLEQIDFLKRNYLKSRRKNKIYKRYMRDMEDYITYIWKPGIYVEKLVDQHRINSSKVGWRNSDQRNWQETRQKVINFEVT